MSSIQMQYRQSVYDQQQSDVTMRTLDNIIEGLNPKSDFEVQISRFCFILLCQIKAMNSASDDVNEESDVEPLIETEDYPETAETDSDIIPKIPMKPDDVPSEPSMNVDVYKDGNKTGQAQLNYDNCATVSCNEVGEKLTEVEVKTEPLIYELTQPSVVELDDIPTARVAKVNPADQFEDLDMPSIVELELDLSTTLTLGDYQHTHGWQGLAGRAVVKSGGDQTDLSMNVDVFKDDNETEQAQGTAVSCNEVGERFSEAEVKTEPLVYELVLPPVVEPDDIPTVFEVTVSDEPSVLELEAPSSVRLTEERLHKCSVCGKGCRTNGHLTVHMMTHTGERPFKCSVCGKGFRTNSNLTVHMRNHTGERPHKCSVCGKGFTAKGNLTHHMITHTGERPYACTVCGKGFTQKSSLTVHMVIHSERPRPHQCSICNKTFTKKSNLTTHMVIHTGERSYECSLCCKRFRGASQLTVHMRTHTGEKPYKCSVCGKGFTSSGHLTVHMNTHKINPPRPHKCTVCGKGFMQKYSLTVHMVIHTGDRSFECSICKKGFSLKGNLAKHMRARHTVERPHKCTVCGKGYGQKIQLTNHMRNHTGERPHKCSVCGKGFTMKGILTKHMDTHTGGRP